MRETPGVLAKNQACFIKAGLEDGLCLRHRNRHDGRGGGGGGRGPGGGAPPARVRAGHQQPAAPLA
jgi:hypothetical protein